VRSAAAVLLLLLGTTAAGRAAGPPAQPPDYGAAGTPDQAAGRALLAEFRGAAPDQCYYEFTLQLRPRRGDLRTIPGRLWAGRTAGGPVLRLILDPGAADERRWLIQGGPRPAAWRGEGAAPARAADLFEPLFPGMDVTAFDLEPSFLYWPGESLLSVNRLLGRPAYVFFFPAPAAFAAAHPDVGGVRVYFDTQYKQPRKTELLSSAGGVRRTLTVNDVKLSPPVVKEVDFRNEATRDTTRFAVTAAAVGLDLLPSLFTPDELGAEIAPPAGGRLVRF
jgi:hypothetical protein